MVTKNGKRKFSNQLKFLIPVSSLIDLETCTVKIINVLSSLGTNSTEFKDLIFGNLIKIIHERNMSKKNSKQ